VPNDLSSPTGVLDSPTTAVLHGMMTTLSEVLGGIDARLASLEQQLRDTRAQTGSPRALAQTVDAAVARLAERIEALETTVVSRPTRDDELHAAVAALAARPDPTPVYDAELRAAVAALANRPPAYDEELRAAVAQILARPEPEPAFDDRLRAAVVDLQAVVADLAARPQPEPVYDAELRAAVADLRAAVAQVAARPDPEPAVDHELRAAVDELRASIIELGARPDPAPVFDHELRAAVADLANRPPVYDEQLRAAVAELAARPQPEPVFDAELRAAVAELAARPPAYDEQLRATVAELAARPPAYDEELRAAVAELAARPQPEPVYDEQLRAAVAELAARPQPEPVFDEELRAAVAELVNRPQPEPVFDNELREAVAQLLLRPKRDDDLHAAVAHLTELVSQPTPPTPADDPVRVGITSLHERLSVLLEMAAQPPPPDDAVRTSLVELQHEVVDLKEHLSTQPLLLEVGERLRQLEERTAANDEDASTALRLALTRLGEIATAIDNIPEPPAVEIPPYPEMPEIPDVAGLVAPIAADVAAMNEILTNHPAAKLVDSMTRVEHQVASLVAQPGPGPAMAMVAAGLAERFEARTDALAESLDAAAARLDAVAAAPTDLAQRVEQFVGSQFADLARREDAVAAALSELQAAVAQAADDTAMAGVLDRVRTVVEGQQGDVAAMRDAMRTLFDAVERHGSVSGQVAELLLENRASLAREIDRLEGVVASHSGDLSERVQAAIEAAAMADAHAVETGAAVTQSIDDAARRMIADVQAMVATGRDPAELDAVAVRISESVRRESELLTQRVASLSVAVDSLRATLDGLSDEMQNSIGRKATEVGRRLAADLGLKGKAKPAGKDRSLPPGASS